MRARALALAAAGAVALGACGGAPATRPTPPAPAPRPPQPASPAPQVAWVADQQRLGAEGLPAIARDGSVVVLGLVLADGARGNPNLTLLVRGRDDRDLERVVVLDPDEAEQLVGADGPEGELAARLAAANARLRALHARHDLQPLARLRVPAPPPAAAPAAALTATDGTHAITWSPHRVVVTRGGATLLEAATPATWVVTPPPGARCANPAVLVGAHAAFAQRAAVLAIGYTGTDACWEPDALPHVVAW